MADPSRVIQVTKPGAAEAPEKNDYLKKIAVRFGIAKYAVLLVAILFVVFMVAFYSDAMTYANARYLLKDFNISQDDVTGNFDQAYYEKQQNMSFALFRGELAVAGNAKLNLYPSGSASSLSYPLSYSQPVLLSSGKYLLCYDLGGRSFSLYTSLANVMKETTENDITACAMGQDGSFALVTRSTSAKYQVEFRNSSLKKQSTYYLDDYVFDVAVSDDGKRIAIVSASLSSSTLKTKLRIASVGKDQYDVVETMDEVMPLQVHFFSDGSLALLCDSCICFYDTKLQLVSRVACSSISHACFGVNGFSMVCATNVVESENDVFVYSSSGEALLQQHVPYKVQSVALDEDNACYLLCNGFVAQLIGEERFEKEYSGTVVSLLASNHYLFLCRTTNVLTWNTEKSGGFYEYYS